MRRILVILSLALLSSTAFAQVDKREVRAGNRDFKKGMYPDAELDYRKALNLDSTSVAANYNLASALYRKGEFDGASKFISKISKENRDARVWFNEGDIALQKKDYSAAAEAFKQALLLEPDDRDAKENYTYAKMMIKNNGGGGGGSDQNNQDNKQDQNQNQNQNDQDQDQNQDQNNKQDNDNRDGQGQQQEAPTEMTQSQAEQLLQAIRAKEEDTQEKVNKEKALMVKSRQKEKNW